MLYRLTYTRSGAPCSATFSAADAIEAAEFSTLWERTIKLPVLTMVPLGISKIPDIDYKRRYQT